MADPKNLIGRQCLRIALHNGVHISIPGKNGAAPRSDVVKSVFSADPVMARQGKICADRMTLIPIGVLCEFAGGMEKVVPFSNIYEADLAPEGKLAPEAESEAAADVLKEVHTIRRGRPPKNSEGVET